MEQLTKEDYREIVKNLGVIQTVMATQPFPRDTPPDLRSALEKYIVEKINGLSSLSDKICRIHLD